jgi:hypothetical protein
MRLHSTAPVFQVRDVGATMAWFVDKLGFRPHPFPATPPHAFAVLERDGVEIMLQRRDAPLAPEPGAWHVYVRVANGLIELFERLRGDAEVTVLEAPRRQPYGDTELDVRTPDGHVLVFSEVIVPDRS